MHLALRSNILKFISALIVIGVASYYSNFVFIFIHSLVNIFAGGRSFTKVFLFLIYLIGLCVVVGIKRPRTTFLPKYFKHILLGAIILLNLLNVVSFVWFASHNGFSVTDYIISVNNNELSTTKLLHNHTLKGAIGTVMNSSPSAVQENIDTGLAFVGLIPNWIYVLTILLSIAILIGLVLFFGQTWQKFPRPLIFALFYGIITFSLVKNFFDGGPLTHESIISLAFFLWLIIQDNKSAKRWLIGIIASYVIFLAVGYWQNLLTTFSSFSYQLYLTLLYSLILGGLLYLSSGKPFNRLAKLFAVLIIVLSYFQVVGDLYMLKYRTMVIEENALVSLYEPPKINPDSYKLINTVGALHIYEFTPQQKTKVSDILTENNLLDNFYPVSIPWKNCLPFSDRKKYQFDLHTPSELQNLNPPITESLPVSSSNSSLLGLKTVITPLGNNHNLFGYHVIMDFPQCWPREVNIVQEYFKDKGLSTFYINNLEIK